MRNTQFVATGTHAAGAFGSGVAQYVRKQAGGFVARVVDYTNSETPLEELLIDSYSGRLHIFADGTVNAQRALMGDPQADETPAADENIENHENEEIRNIQKGLLLEHHHFVAARAQVIKYLVSLKS